MQIYFATRGNSWDVDFLIARLKTLVHTWEIEDIATGKVTKEHRFGILRPVQLWEYAFPKQDLDIVMNSLNLSHPNGAGYHEKKIGLMAASIRMALGAKPLPKPKSTKFFPMPVENMKNIQIIPIGVREDKMIEYDGKRHEAI